MKTKRIFELTTKWQCQSIVTLKWVKYWVEKQLENGRKFGVIHKDSKFWARKVGVFFVGRKQFHKQQQLGVRGLKSGPKTHNWSMIIVCFPSFDFFICQTAMFPLKSVVTSVFLTRRSSNIYILMKKSGKKWQKPNWIILVVFQCKLKCLFCCQQCDSEIWH